MPSSLNSSSYLTALRFGAWGAGGCVVGGLLGGIFLPPGPQPGLVNILLMAFLFGAMGAGTCVALLGGHSRYLQRRFRFWRSLGGGLPLGLLAGGMAGGIAQFVFNVAQSVYGPAQEASFSGWAIESARVFCWGIAGALMGLGLSLRIPNLGPLRGLGGGIAGGLIGGAIYVVCLLISGLLVGGLLGNAIIGFFIGLMIILAESFFRQAWLEVVYGPNEIRTVSLGRETVSIGSDRSCTVYIRNAPPVALRYRLDQGEIICDDVSSNSKRHVQPGDQMTIGSITVVVRAIAGSQAVTQPPSSFSLHVGSRTTPLSPGTRLRASDVPGLEPQSTDGIVAEVTRNPQDPTVLGLKNLSCRSWTAILRVGESREVNIGQSIRLAEGTRILFGSSEGEIRA